MQRGDVVRLKAEIGPRMIVTGRRNEAVDLMWFRKDDSYNTASFNEDLLEIVPTKPLYRAYGNWDQGLGKMDLNFNSFKYSLIAEQQLKSAAKLTSKDFKIGKKYKCVDIDHDSVVREKYLNMIVCCLEKDYNTTVEAHRNATILSLKVRDDMIGRSYHWTSAYKFEEV
jgi:uncharacterized protein YodC (DUF2158 family)